MLGAGRRQAVAAAAGTLAGLLLAGCGGGPGRGPARSSHPSILLISVDTLRADHLGCYGARDAATPAFDAWAREGVLFEQARTHTPITLPAHASLLTGRLPHRNGVRDNAVYGLPSDVPTLAESLAAAGYETAAVVGAAVLDRQYGLARGFGRYDDAMTGAGGLTIAERPADAVTRAALAAGRELKPPFFLFVHYYDPHAAYEPPAPFAERFASRPYDGEVAFVDSEIGRLRRELEAAGKMQDTVVVLVSDHGEGLGEHGEATHGVFLYDSTLHVPLVVVAPGRWPAGRRASAPVALTDVAPTLLELAGVAAPAGLDGRSLRSLFDAPASPAARWLPLESEFGYNSYGWAPLVGLTDGRSKWVGAPEPELYDLAQDPHEARNLATERADERKRLAELWRRAVTEDRRALAGGAPSREDAERLAQLASLGYVAGSAAPAERRADLPDPKRAIASLDLVNDARRLIGEKRYAEAGQRLEAALAVSPRNLSALVLAGSSALLAGQPQKAIEPLRRATLVGPANADAHFNLGLALLGAGDVAQAEAAWRRTLALAPRYHDAAVNLIDVLSRTGRPQEAEAVLRNARHAALASPTLDFLDGRLAAARGDRAAARSALERALAGPLPPPAAAEARSLLRALEH